MATKFAERPEGATPSVEDLIDRARALHPALAEQAAETERAGRVPSETIDLVKQAGLHRIMQPAQFGGFAYGPSAVFKVCFELARACPNTSWSVMVANSNAWFTAYWPAEVQSDVWDGHADDLVAISGIPVGKGRKVEGGYEIWGAWPWASNCDNCEWAIVAAPVADTEGGEPETQWFHVRMSDLTIAHDSWNMSGMQGSGSKTLLRNDPLLVPDSARVRLAEVMQDTTPGRSIPGNEVASYNFGTLSGVVLLGPVLGMVQGALDVFVETMRAKVKTSLKAGATATAAGQAATQMRVADASARIDAARALLLSSVEPFEAKVRAGDELTVAERVAIRRNIGFAAQQAFEAMNILARGAGASPFALKSPFQRFWRDLTVSLGHVTLDTDGIYVMYGQQAFGLPPLGSH